MTLGRNARNEIIGKATVNTFRCMSASAQNVLEQERLPLAQEYVYER